MRDKTKTFDTNYSNQDGQSYLHIYAGSGDVTALEVFITAGADVNMRDKHGMTPMHYAALNGHLPALRMLFNAGADPAVLTNDGQTVLDMAEHGEHEFLAQHIRKRFRGPGSTL